MEDCSIRLMTFDDLAFADALRSGAGWNQTPEFWRWLIERESNGCFIAECDGQRAGTAATFCYGTELAWIGMVIVDPQFRRRGLGSLLMQRCLDHLRDRVRVVRLDASPFGQPIYERLGFKADWKLVRYERLEPTTVSAPAGTLRVGPLAGETVAEVSRFDERAFGAPRTDVLEFAASTSLHTSIARDASGGIRGFGCIRRGAQRFQIGPLVAEDARAAERIVASLLEGVIEPVGWNVPEPNRAAAELARQLGFTPGRELVRMTFGNAVVEDDPLLQFSICDPAIG